MHTYMHTGASRCDRMIYMEYDEQNNLWVVDDLSNLACPWCGCMDNLHIGLQTCPDCGHHVNVCKRTIDGITDYLVTKEADCDEHDGIAMQDYCTALL